jgi:NifU-like protein involved in Fe-S cluster formation
MSAYPQLVLEYFRHPVLSGGAMLRGEAGSVEQGAWICVTADVVVGRLQNVGFHAFACPHIIAACNRAAELLEGAPAEALQDLQLDKLQHEFEIPVEKAGKLLILKDAFANCYAANVGVA